MRLRRMPLAVCVDIHAANCAALRVRVSFSTAFALLQKVRDYRGMTAKHWRFKKFFTPSHYFLQCALYSGKALLFALRTGVLWKQRCRPSQASVSKRLFRRKAVQADNKVADGVGSNSNETHYKTSMLRLGSARPSSMLFPIQCSFLFGLLPIRNMRLNVEQVR